MSNMLKTIRSPRDLRQLPLERLGALAKEVRQVIIERFDMREDYKASALGLVDLTIALHFVFDFSLDRLVFDLTHQCAAHTVITRGIPADGGSLAAAFPGKESPPYDHFFSTHAGTSISRALGLACGANDSSKTVAVIGDGAVVTGVALEALNMGGALNRDVLVILNDNEMSISKVVGAMAEYFSRIRVGKTYNALKKDAHKLLQSIPVIGERLDKAAEQVRDAVSKALVPGHMFEMLGPRYFGPVDGHNVAHLANLLLEIKRLNGFCLLHVVTRRESPRPATRSVSTSAARVQEPEFEHQGEELWMNALTQHVTAAAERDPAVVTVIAAPPEVGGIRTYVDVFNQKFSGRSWSVEVCEAHGLAFAAGLAKAGRRPVVLITSALLQRAYDQVFQELSQQSLPILLIVAMAGVVGEEHVLSHGLHDVAYLRTMPGIDLLSPRDGEELRTMIDWALVQPGPTALRIPSTFMPHPEHLLPLRSEFLRGKSEVLRRGSDLAVFAYGQMVYPLMEAVERLREKGLESTVINARFARPLDVDALRSAVDDHTVVFTLEEHSVAGGFGSAVLETAARLRLGAGKIVPIAVSDELVAYGARPEILKTAGLDPTSLHDRLLVEYRRFVRGSSRG